MAKQLIATCPGCGNRFAVVPDLQRELKFNQIVTGEESGVLDLICLTCGHRFQVDSSELTRA
jgi:hypothetical protein